ncbi:MAG: nucleoside monophosphate kinase [Minisyncoccia bacterium]
MSPQTFVFIGRSGCGKGTQADLLMKKLKEKQPDDFIFYLETGQKFRDFISASGYSNQLAKTIQDKGALQPSFLAVWIWSDILIEKLRKDDHLFIDGTPRKLGEAIIFFEALKFYSRKPNVIYINVSRTWSEERLSERHRSDDMFALVKKRLDWFDSEVMPAVEYFKDSLDVNFFDVNGERSIEDIHTDIVSKLKW